MRSSAGAQRAAERFGPGESFLTDSSRPPFRHPFRVRPLPVFPVLTLEDIRSALGCPRPADSAPPFTPEWRNASVAMALAGDGDGLEACFILRTERDGDPWSGQVAFPGGRAEPGDADAAAVAERETWGGDRAPPRARAMRRRPPSPAALPH